MDTSLLKTFLEVSRTRNFAKAADNLFVTSAAVSARIKQLESQLGVALFVRHRGNMRMTAEAERLQPLAESMVNTWSRALQEVSLQPEMETRIHVGATSSVWQLALNEAVVDILDAYPEVAVRTEGHSIEDLARLLLDRTLDLVILPDPPATTGVISSKIGDLTLVLATTFATKNAGNVEQALGQGYCYVDWGPGFAAFHAEKFGERPTTLQSNFSSVVLHVLEKKGGAAYLPRRAMENTPWLKAVKGAPSFKRAIYACYQEGNTRLALIEQVVSSLNGMSV